MNIDTAKELLLELAKEIIKDFWGDFPEEAKEEFRRKYSEQAVVKAEELIRQLENK